MKNIKYAIFALALFLPASQLAAAVPHLPTPQAINFNPPKGNRYVLTNGLVFRLMPDHTLPVIKITALLKTGTIYEPKDKVGLAGLTAATIRESGSAKYPSDELNKTLEYMGASAETGVDEENAGFSASGLSKDTEKLLDIVSSLMTAPAFDPAKLELKKSDLLEAILRRNDNPEAISGRESRRMFYGADNPYGRRVEAAGVSSITIDDVKKFYAENYRPQGTIIAVTGDFQLDDMVHLVTRAFSDWNNTTPAPAAPKAAAPKAERKVYLVSKEVENAPVRIYMPGPKRHDPSEYALEIGNYVLGGSSMNSRLFQEIRTKRGLAYSVSSFWSKNDLAGIVGAYYGTKNESVPQAARETLRQYDIMRNVPLTSGELRTAKDGILNSYIFSDRRHRIR